MKDSHSNAPERRLCLIFLIVTLPSHLRASERATAPIQKYQDHSLDHSLLIRSHHICNHAVSPPSHRVFQKQNAVTARKAMKWVFLGKFEENISKKFLQKHLEQRKTGIESEEGRVIPTHLIGYR